MDIKRRIGMASAMVGKLGKIWKSKNTSIRTEMGWLRRMVGVT